ncbi:type 1 glutamine amidotransferase domain-containing protein [Erythrobacter sp. WG]|uniref:type 1 glutamine amidotransferase domain-containing protein n=1 Tax=Erythrobacter sp. WG TaxID=2985510 RepID=UPI0022713171|nr:type 1 glutamine amidotransferase domain-containing protein [Erythrobacter sp. WG]MCX9146672.1 type 1 glutamine amidotransferase [Erythrobacter sp. WG]
MQRVLIIATDGFEQSELVKPRDLLAEAGAQVTIASLEPGEIRGWDQKDWGQSVPVDCTIGEVSVEDYDALLLPGGQMNPDILRTEHKVIEIVRAFDAAEKPIAAICHAPWLLAEADIIEGHTVTGWPSIRTDLANAGAAVVDEEVVVDRNLITSRKPDDIPAFTEALMAALNMEPAEQSA